MFCGFLVRYNCFKSKKHPFFIKKMTFKVKKIRKHDYLDFP